MKKLGFGAMRLPVLGGDNAKIDIEQFQKMADYYIEQGFNYFDTAYFYHKGCSEAAIKEVIVNRYSRDSFWLVDKMPVSLVQSKDDYDRIFNEQLKRAGVDYFDLYLLHALNEREYRKTINNGGFEYMKMLKEQGKIKHIGFSYHDKADLLDEILSKHPEMEYVQLQINYIDWDDEAIQSKKCYDTAMKYNKKILVMEPIKGGALANVPTSVSDMFDNYNPSCSAASWAIRFAASLDNVVMVLSGMSNIEQVKDNCSYMFDFKPLCEDEKQIIKKAADIIKGRIVVPCTACRYCVPHCPKNIAIADYLSLLNNKKQVDTWVPSFYYEQLSLKFGKASECISCRKCEAKCPQHIEISKYMKMVAETFDKK